MYQKSMEDAQTNQALSDLSIDSYLVTGLTSIDADRELDYFIDRPKGMKGYILNLTLKGQGQVFDGQDMHHCNPGDLLLFSPKRIQHYGRSSKSDNWHYRWIYFRPRTHWGHWLEWHSRKGFIGFISLVSETLRSEFEKLFSSIEHTHQSGRKLADELSMNLLERLLLRCIEEDPQNPKRVHDPRIIQSCQYITSNLANPLTIDEIARHACLSASRLTHLFREEVGVNILRWREEQRMIRAKLLLEITQDAIGSIGRRIGYEDQLYFSRVFRKQVGVSPSEYRQQQQINYL